MFPSSYPSISVTTESSLHAGALGAGLAESHKKMNLMPKSVASVLFFI